MAGEKEAAKFGNETHDDCSDDARTQQNRDTHTVDDGGMDNAHQEARSRETDRPPTRDAGASHTER